MTFIFEMDNYLVISAINSVLFLEMSLNLV